MNPDLLTMEIILAGGPILFYGTIAFTVVYFVVDFNFMRYLQKTGYDLNRSAVESWATDSWRMRTWHLADCIIGALLPVLLLIGAIWMATSPFILATYLESLL